MTNSTVLPADVSMKNFVATDSVTKSQQSPGKKLSKDLLSPGHSGSRHEGNNSGDDERNLLPFTMHKILLQNGVKTINDDQVLLAESAVWKSIEKTIDLFIPSTPAERKNMRVADLGCLEGGYAAEFARMGFETIGIEAREDNLQKCNYVKANLPYANLNFIKDDARNVGNYGTFDITLCYGLLYHLNDPVAFLRTLEKCTSKMLLLNTHFAPERDFRYNLGFLNKYVIGPIQKRTGFFESQKNYRLSRIKENEGYRGRWYREWNKNEKKEKVEKLLWASYNNPKSFWLCKKDLTHALHDIGFKAVYEPFDFTGDLFPDNYTDFQNRTMFVALKY